MYLFCLFDFEFIISNFRHAALQREYTTQSDTNPSKFRKVKAKIPSLTRYNFTTFEKTPHNVATFFLYFFLYFCSIPVNYRPQRSCGQGNIFTPVCHSVHRGGVSLSTCWDTTTPPPRDQAEPPDCNSMPFGVAWAYYGKVLILANAALPGFPPGLENLEKWEGIFQSGKSQGILNRLEKSGKSQGKSYKILEKSGNLR